MLTQGLQLIPGIPESWKFGEPAVWHCEQLGQGGCSLKLLAARLHECPCQSMGRNLKRSVLFSEGMQQSALCCVAVC